MQINLFNKSIIKATPFMKWVGGKRQLISEIEKRLPSEIIKTRKIKSYYEPFIGGGALLFYLKSNYDINKTYISDVKKCLNNMFQL